MTQRHPSPFALLACLSAAALFGACSPSTTDPCAKGSHWSYDTKQCVRELPDGGDEPTESNEAGVPASGSDAAVHPEVPDDAGELLDASAPPEAGTIPTDPPDAGDPPSLDAGRDASLDAGEADSGADAAAPPPGPACDPEDQEAWSDFHVSGTLLSSIASCFAAHPLCALGVCPLDQCLQAKAGVLGCQDCVTAEVECVAARCIAACGSKGSEDACRACACANGCIDAFDACNGGEALNVCQDCYGLQCGYSLSPALIMVVVGGLLLLP